MPNNVTNMVSIRAPLDVLIYMRRDLAGLCYDFETGNHIRIPFALDRIVPQPEEVLESLKRNDSFVMSNDLWYKWRLENRGTKWEAYDFGHGGEPDPFFYQDEPKWVVYFCTAWQPPKTSVWHRLVNVYPTATVKHAYANEDVFGGKSGIAVYEMTSHGPCTTLYMDRSGDENWCRRLIDRDGSEE